MPLNRSATLLLWSCHAALLLVLVLPAGAAQARNGMARAERHESKHEIEQLEQAWHDAIIRRNVPQMADLLSADYIAISANGSLQSKEQTLANLQSGQVRLKSIDVQDRKVRFYGRTAVVTSKAEVQGTTPEGDLSGEFRYTRVYVRDENGKWKIVSFEASRIREPGEHHP